MRSPATTPGLYFGFRSGTVIKVKAFIQPVDREPRAHSRIGGSGAGIGRVVLALALLLSLAAPVLPARAAEFTLRNGLDNYTGTSDACLLQNYGNLNSYEAAIGNHDYGFCRAVLRFDLSALTNETVLAAELRLYRGFIDAGSWTNKAIRLYPIHGTNADWQESSATYALRKTGTNWYDADGNALTDFGTSPLPYDTNNLMGSFTVNSADPNGTLEVIPLSAAGIACLQNWIDHPAQNAGFAFVSSELEALPPTALWRFATAGYTGQQGGNITWRPTLVITVFTDESARGVPVAWLQQHGSTSHYAVVEAEDPDNDGAVTWEEYYAGTVPTNRQSAFRVIAISAGVQPTITWYGTTNSGVRLPFSMLRSTNGIGTNWDIVAPSLARADSGTNVWADPSPPAGPAFYRPVLQVDPPPSAPEAPTALVASGFDQQALLAWKAPTQNGGAAITDYLVDFKPTTAAQWMASSDGLSAATKAIVTGLVNGCAYEFRVRAVNAAGSGSFSETAPAAPREIRTLAFVINGESNSGGIGLNSDATSAERASRSVVQIMNLTNGLFTFENLQLGVNNLRDHAELSAYYDTCHGFENQLANAVEAQAFRSNATVYLIKTGQGGSTVAQWAVGLSYWTKFLERINAGKPQLPAQPQWVVWISLGINDALGETPIGTWKTAMIAHLNKIKAELPGTIVILTGFQSMGYAAVNQAIAEIAAEEPNVFAVDSSAAALRDANHWNYAGLKTVTAELVATTEQALGL